MVKILNQTLDPSEGVGSELSVFKVVQKREFIGDWLSMNQGEQRTHGDWAEIASADHTYRRGSKTVRNEAQLVIEHVDRINPHESSTGVRMARISTWLSAWIRHGARVP